MIENVQLSGRSASKAGFPTNLSVNWTKSRSSSPFVNLAFLPLTMRLTESIAVSAAEPSRRVTFGRAHERAVLIPWRM